MRTRHNETTLAGGRQAVVILRPTGDAAGDARLRFAAGEGWLAAPDLLSNGAPPAILGPSGWLGPGQSDKTGAVVGGWEGSPAPGGADGFVVLNGRYRAEPSSEAVAKALEIADADIVALCMNSTLSAYGEKLQATADGMVLGFRRFYRDAVAPGSIGPEWPHIAFMDARAMGILGAAGLAGPFSGAASALEAAGLRIAAFDVAGHALDLASEEGLLACMDESLMPSRSGAAPSGHLAGRVAAAADAFVARDATIVGPAYLGRRSSVAGGVIVRRSIVGESVSVPAGAHVSGRVLLCQEDLASGETRAPARPETPEGDCYRTWPLFSWPGLGKRVFDVVFSVAVLMVTATLFPLVALAVKLTSKGPVFYAHNRQGRHGKVFRCLKFRTMVQGADAVQETLRAINEVDGPQFKLVDDPRVTVVGAFLRATNLDELPQFFNVIAGDMSVVGPRPSPDRENQLCPMWREARLSVRPGITGLWQVSRSRDKGSDFHEWIHYDVEYVRRVSPQLDMLVIARTASVMGRAFARLFTARGTVNDAAAS